MTTNRRAAALLVATCAALTEAIGRHMPAGPYRDFATWAFSTRNPRQREFLQATGVIQMINLNTTLLSGLIGDDDWPAVLNFTGRINAYQVMEVGSDKLTFGLAATSLDQGALERRALVSSVNRAMIEALSAGRSTPAILLLAGHAQRAAQTASAVAHSLATTHADLAEDYRHHLAEREVPVPELEDLSHGVWPSLVTGVELCREVAGALPGTASASLLRQGLSDRYRAVERTLSAEHLSRIELAVLGAQTTLVGPALIYFLGLIMEMVKPVKEYPATVSDGSLAETLTDAALLVRLQNDIGTQLLRLAPAQQAARMRQLETENDVLQALSGTVAAEFTRLHKDVRNAESNVALWHARRATSPAQARTALAESLTCYAAMYAHHSARLARGLADLDDRLGDRRASALIERMVRFHERMYSHSHTEPAGEYAV